MDEKISLHYSKEFKHLKTYENADIDGKTYSMFINDDLNVVIEVWDSKWIEEEKRWDLISITKSELMSAEEGDQHWKKLIDTL